jgi:carbonic anhydrase
VAGNVADTDEIASLEYAAEHLNTPLLVVLGHSKCGAVTAVVENAPLHGNLLSLASKIKPAVSRARTEHRDLSGPPLVEEAVKANVWRALEDLFRQSHILKGLVKEGKLKILGAIYDLDHGAVQWLGTHPRQEQFLGATARPAVRSIKVKGPQGVPAPR